MFKSEVVPGRNIHYKINQDFLNKEVEVGTSVKSTPIQKYDIDYGFS